MEKTKDVFALANRKKRKGSVFTTVIIVILLVYAALLLGLLAWAIITSFKDDLMDFRRNPIGLPKKWVLTNYQTALERFSMQVSTSRGLESVKMPTMFLNGFLYALGCSFAATFIPCIVGYLCAKFKYKFSSIVYLVVIICMILPIVGNMPAELQMTRFLHIYGELWGTWFMKANFLGLYFIVFYNFFRSLPDAYSEAAKIDGAGNFRILFRVCMPLAMPLFFTVMLINFIAMWNDYQTPLIYLRQTYPTIALGMYEIGMSEQSFATVPVKVASAVMVLVPVFILFSAFHKKLLGNLTMGGIKG